MSLSASHLLPLSFLVVSLATGIVDSVLQWQRKEYRVFVKLYAFYFSNNVHGSDRSNWTSRLDSAANSLTICAK